ncbi:zinc finger MYM-type protein 4 [Austrofundulus limnaeus]|uniref:Zinc finger MYM-type protein 4 n=1 Tax=Austrofundulus limnaeus TaxID=52670 RepID=A0A2I4BBD8_AUSLI|nr:PREDICTED: zinc finger MYM-type protein 4-like [Austrofundulus limnaeus]
MADTEECRLKRLKHEEQMSRMFDEVMGLGDFADSSRGSAASSKSGGQAELKGLDESSGQKLIEEDSNGSRREEKTDETTGEATGETTFPQLPSSSSDQLSPFNMKRGGGEAAFDDALDGLPPYGPEEEDEDWHFALPMGSLEDVDLGKTNTKTTQFGPGNSASRAVPLASKAGDDGEEEERQEREGSGESANTSHSSQDNTPDDSRGTDVPNQTEETEDSQLDKTSEAAPVPESNPPTCPPVNIKDEPIDEGYDAALLPQNAAKQIKEEMEQEELRISSVFSVGGANTFTSPTIATAIPGSTQTAFFIPGRGAILQAMTPLSVRPPLPVAPSIPTLTAIPQIRPPPPPPVPGSVRCSGCLKILLKGQTAFQRKGSTQLFCSTVCLTGHLPAVAKARACFQCFREITQPRDMVTIPAENNSFMHFCGQFCLSVFRHKKKQVDNVSDKLADKRQERKPEKPPEKPAENQILCSVCKATNKQIEHEVTHQGKLFKLCSDNCFLRWRNMRQLAMNCCEGCGLYCNSNSSSCQTLTVEKTQLYFCSPTCVGTYKQSCKKSTECANCHKTMMVSSTIMERDQKGKVQLYCSSDCVEQTRPVHHSLTGTPFPCSLCKVSAVPQYHLAMVDGTIRNFCSYDCVSTFRKSDYTSQLELTNGTSSLRDPSTKDVPKPGPSAGTSSVPPVPQDIPSSVPYSGHHPSHTSVPPLVPPSSATSSPTVPAQSQARSPPDQAQKPSEDGLSNTPKVTCHQCSKRFNTKPLLLSHQGHFFIFCSKPCSDHYKVQKNVLAVCESCQQEKVLFDTITYNQQDLFFCSENCKLRFRQERSCRPCTFCASFGQKMVLSHYGGKTEEFCKPHCMSQFTVLYYGMGRCDSCRKQGYMGEKLQCLGSVRNFCNMACLLHYCYQNFETSQHMSSNGTGTTQMPCAPTQPHHLTKMNPVIADVVSLANGSAAQPSVSADTALTGALPTSNVDGKNLDHASTQTDAMRVPAPRRRQMKNKSVLCRPFTMDQESMCQLPSTPSESEASAKEDNVKMCMVPVPVPVPVFIPVPMNMYSQHTPVPMLIPVPVPVPFVVPPQTKDVKDVAVQMETVQVEMVQMEDSAVKEENKSVPAEGLRSSAEDLRGSAEDLRGSAAGLRSSAEDLRGSAAGLRSSAEDLRGSAEDLRGSAEDLRGSAEDLRGSAEDLRGSAAGLRGSAEDLRGSAAGLRGSAEDLRGSAEELRGSAEDLRGSAEDLRGSAEDLRSSAEDPKPEVVSPSVCEDEEAPEAADLPQTGRSPEPPTENPNETIETGTDPPPGGSDQPPSSPLMDLEADFPQESLDLKPLVQKRGVKRPRDRSYSRKRSRRRTGSSDRRVFVTPAASKLNHLYGVKAWTSWVQQAQKGEQKLVLCSVR